MSLGFKRLRGNSSYTKLEPSEQATVSYFLDTSSSLRPCKCPLQCHWLSRWPSCSSPFPVSFTILSTYFQTLCRTLSLLSTTIR